MQINDKFTDGVVTYVFYYMCWSSLSICEASLYTAKLLGRPVCCLSKEQGIPKAVCSVVLI